MVVLPQSHGEAYTSLEMDALVVKQIGLTSMDWFVHNKIQMTGSSSGLLTPLMVYGSESNWVMRDGESAEPYSSPFSLPNLKTVPVPNAEYLWLDASGNPMAESDMGWAPYQSATHLGAIFNMMKLSTEQLTITIDGQTVLQIPASASFPQKTVSSTGIGKLPLNWYYPGSGWSEPTNQIHGTPTGPMAAVASQLQIIENQRRPYSENYPGKFPLQTYFVFGNNSSQVYLILAELNPSLRCMNCPSYADTHGTVKVTLSPTNGMVDVFLGHGGVFPWSIAYASTNIPDPGPSKATQFTITQPSSSSSIRQSHRILRINSLSKDGVSYLIVATEVQSRLTSISRSLLRHTSRSMLRLMDQGDGSLRES